MLFTSLPLIGAASSCTHVADFSSPKHCQKGTGSSNIGNEGPDHWVFCSVSERALVMCWEVGRHFSLPLRAAWSRRGEDENRPGPRRELWERWAHGRCPSSTGKAELWPVAVRGGSESSDLQPGPGGGGKHWTCLGDTISSWSGRTIARGRMGWGRDKEAVGLERWGRFGRWCVLVKNLIFKTFS